jgi:hypothetical protein
VTLLQNDFSANVGRGRAKKNKIQEVNEIEQQQQQIVSETILEFTVSTSGTNHELIRHDCKVNFV